MRKPYPAPHVAPHVVPLGISLLQSCRGSSNFDVWSSSCLAHNWHTASRKPALQPCQQTLGSIPGRSLLSPSLHRAHVCRCCRACGVWMRNRIGTGIVITEVCQGCIWGSRLVPLRQSKPALWPQVFDRHLQISHNAKPAICRANFSWSRACYTTSNQVNYTADLLAYVEGRTHAQDTRRRLQSAARALYCIALHHSWANFPVPTLSAFGYASKLPEGIPATIVPMPSRPPKDFLQPTAFTSFAQ